MNWTKNIPLLGGWYKHRKNGIETSYFLKSLGLLHPLMPSDLLFAMKDEESNSGKNIIGISNREFKNCEWLGPLSKEPLKQWFYSI